MRIEFNPSQQKVVAQLTTLITNSQAVVDAQKEKLNLFIEGILSAKEVTGAKHIVVDNNFMDVELEEVVEATPV